jgi:putative flippase GtrA
MRKRLSDLVAWSKTHEGKKLIRFASVSAISTVVSFTTISVVYGTQLVRGEIASTVVGNMVATIPSYYLNRTWTWGKKGRSHFRGEIVPFWLMAVLGTTFSIVGATFAGHLVSTHHWHHLVNTAIVAIANLVSFGIFWVLKLKVFNRIFHVDELSEMDKHRAVEEAGRSN